MKEIDMTEKLVASRCALERRRFGRAALILLAGALAAAASQAAVINVNTVTDVVNGLDGLCSLREAITASNVNAPSGAAAGECVAGSPSPVPDVIQFSIVGTIQPVPGLGPLPSLTDGRAVLDGWSAPGASPGRPPRVGVDGSLLGVDNGLKIVSAQNRIRGFLVKNFGLNGIRIEGGGTSKNRVVGCHIGTNRLGTTAQPNNTGVSIASGATDNIIGTNGDGVRDRQESNLISGNTQDGVSITGTGTEGNRVAGNRIGTNRTGTAALGNGIEGVAIGVLAMNNIVGTDSSGDPSDADEGNLISGNGQRGVNQFADGSTIIAGNIVGLNRAGNAAIPNLVGIQLLDLVTGMRIGTDGDGVSDVEERNVISGNTAVGITARGQNNFIAGNYIGTDLTGTVAIPNGSGISAEIGPLMLGGPLTIGGPDERFRNVISGHVGTGVNVTAMGVLIQCNYFGTDASGTLPLGNLTGVNVTAGVNASLFDNKFAFNDTGAVSGEPTTVATNNIFTGNTVNGFLWGDPGVIDITNNWWGDPSGPTHPGNPGGTGDSVLENGGGTALYNPWLVVEPDLCDIPD